jgi:hypothetical protein
VIVVQSMRATTQSAVVTVTPVATLLVSFDVSSFSTVIAPEPSARKMIDSATVSSVAL